MTGAHVIVIGAGNIGSHVTVHLARMVEVARITIVDFDRYTADNLAGQDVTRRDVGRSKAAVQAARLRRIRPAIGLVAHACRVEDLPLGALRADAILSCLDSRAARQHVNEAAWRLGGPWIDAAVDGSQLLVRVNTYRPAPGAPCLECGWDDRDYDALEQEYPCQAAPVRATAAPSAVGAIAAGLQAIECRKLLSGQPVRFAAGRQVLLDLAFHKQYATTLPGNPACAMADHAVWPIRALDRGPGALSVNDALGLQAPPAASVGVAGRRLAARLVCAACGAERRGWRFVPPRTAGVVPCRRCGGPLVAPGGDLVERIPRDMARGPFGRRTLASLGVRAGDVLIVGGDTGVSYLEVGRDRR